MGAPAIHMAAVRADDYVIAAYGAHRHEVYSFLARATGNDAEAAELLQVVFLRLAHETRDGRRPSDVCAWLLGAASSLAMRRLHRRSAAERLVGWFGREREGTRARSRELAIGHQLAADMERALRELADDERLVLLLASRGFSGRKVAEAIGRTEPSTRATICRARMRVFAELDGCRLVHADDRFLEVAAASLDFELTPAEQAALDEHLAGCEGCRGAAPQLRAQARLLASLPTRVLPGPDAEAILGRVLGGGFRVPPVRLMGATAVLALAALVAIAVGADLLRRSQHPATLVEPAIVAPSAVVAASGPPDADVFMPP